MQDSEPTRLLGFHQVAGRYSGVRNKLTTLLYLMFLVVMAYFCFKRPMVSFDKYIYEAIVLSREESLEQAHQFITKHYPDLSTSPRAGTTAGLAMMEPYYTIRPLYLLGVAAVHEVLGIENSLSFISALGVFGTGIVLLLWTRKPILSALMLGTPAFVVAGRLGGPDASAMFFLSAAALCLFHRRLLIGLALLLASVWVRTDSILFVLLVLAWLWWKEEITAPQFAVLTAVGTASVWTINYFAGNYGWRVLFMNSFVHFYLPEETPRLTVPMYLRAVGQGLTFIPGELLPLWIVLGAAAWRSGNPLFRPLLLCAAGASVVRFALFPCPDDRYFVWAYVIVAAAFASCWDEKPVTEVRASIALRESAPRATPTKPEPAISLA
jgi:hypothetical protein